MEFAQTLGTRNHVTSSILPDELLHDRFIAQAVTRKTPTHSGEPSQVTQFPPKTGKLCTTKLWKENCQSRVDSRGAFSCK
eukprot:4111008-Pyramimonas_sp.AAC.1